MTSTRALLGGVFVGAALCGCRPALLDRPSVIDGLRVLAVQAQPAEVGPGEAVSLAPLIVDERGVVVGAEAQWAFCRAPKPLTENDSVSAACLDNATAPIATAATDVATHVPADACQLFGSENPTADARPRDPDVTGGYYQPVRIVDDDVTAFAMLRVACKLAGASFDIAQAFAARYVRNQNPALTVTVAEHAHVGADVVIDVSWPQHSAEVFPVFDEGTQELTDDREAMTASYFATSGSFRFDTTGRAGGDHHTSTSNTWTAPAAPGIAHVFVVLRDSRGGVAFAGADVDVR